MIRQGSASLEARVYNELREALLCGQYKKDEWLTEHMLTQKLGVSRTPVRSALQRLAEDGLVSLIPNKGAVVIGIAKEVEERLKDVHKSIHVAVMGCPVNGPGEAKNADIGIAGGNGVGLIFAKGEVIKKVPEEELIDALMEEIEKL